VDTPVAEAEAAAGIPDAAGHLSRPLFLMNWTTCWSQVPLEHGLDDRCEMQASAM
jgi:hypothetical protein